MPGMAGPYVVESSATTKAPLDVASRVIVDAGNYPKWFKGAHDVVPSKDYPAVGGVLRWKVKWGTKEWEFAGRVVQNELPARLVLRVATRRSRGVVTHAFERDGAGTRYTKRVASEGTWLELLAARAFMPRSVRQEVRAAARLADAEA